MKSLCDKIFEKVDFLWLDRFSRHLIIIIAQEITTRIHQSKQINFFKNSVAQRFHGRILQKASFIDFPHVLRIFLILMEIFLHKVYAVKLKTGQKYLNAFFYFLPDLIACYIIVESKRECEQVLLHLIFEFMEIHGKRPSSRTVQNTRSIVSSACKNIRFSKIMNKIRRSVFSKSYTNSFSTCWVKALCILWIISGSDANDLPASINACFSTSCCRI